MYKQFFCNRLGVGLGVKARGTRVGKGVVLGVGIGLSIGSRLGVRGTDRLHFGGCGLNEAVYFPQIFLLDLTHKFASKPFLWHPQNLCVE